MHMAAARHRPPCSLSSAPLAAACQRLASSTMAAATTAGRFRGEDSAGIKAHLQEQGYAVVAAAATPPELRHARRLLWQHLQRAHGWEPGRPETWLDSSFPGAAGAEQLRFAMAGVLPDTPHIDANWYLRTRPGVCRGFAAAYGTEDLVTACVRQTPHPDPSHAIQNTQ